MVLGCQQYCKSLVVDIAKQNIPELSFVTTLQAPVIYQMKDACIQLLVWTTYKANMNLLLGIEETKEVVRAITARRRK